MITVSNLNTMYYREQYASSSSKVYNYYPKVITNRYMHLQIPSIEFEDELVMYSSGNSGSNRTIYVGSDSDFKLHIKISQNNYYGGYYSFSTLVVFYM